MRVKITFFIHLNLFTSKWITHKVFLYILKGISLQQSNRLPCVNYIFLPKS